MSDAIQSAPGEIKLDRPIGLAAGVALVIGGTIGMGIYALIAAVAAQAGSALWIAFTLALLISAVGVLPLIQIASALPRAGGGYLFTSRLLNPYMGIVASYFAILGGASSTALVALGLAGYIEGNFSTGLPIKLIAVLLPILFFILYLFGLRLAAWIQMLLAAQLIIALLVYGFSGAAKYGLDFSISLPQGMGGLIMAVILCYSVCMGFQVIAEMGEEMVNARRNIPLSLLIGGAAVLVIYVIVGTVFMRSIPYDFEAIKAMTAPLMESGQAFLPDFWVMLLSFGALSAGLTSFNAGAIALPRELFSQSRDRLMPEFVGKIDKRTKSPLNAVGLYFLFTVFLVLIGPSLDFFGVMAAVGILVMTAVIAVAAVRLPAKFPERYKSAYFRLPKWLLILVAVISILSCLGFVFIVLTEMPSVGLIYIGWTVLITVFYFARVNSLKKSGFDWEGQISRLPGHDEEEN